MKKKDLYISLYTVMMLIRLTEERIIEEYPKQEMRCPAHLSMGQEAIAAGVCSALSTSDVVLSAHRPHGHYIAKGGNLQAMIAELYGKATGCSRGVGGSQHIIDMSVNYWGSTAIVGSTLPIAVGAALSFVMKNKVSVAAVFFGDAATEEGVFLESVNYAVLRKLPVFFVCENNLYAVNTPINQRQPKRDLFKAVDAMGVESNRVDGNDALAVHAMAKYCVKKLRRGEGPQFIECMTYRYRAHVGPHIDPPGVRSTKEIEYWMRKDPIRSFEKRLLGENVLSEKNMNVIISDTRKMVAEAFDFAKRSPFPKRSGLENLVYSS